MYGKIWGNSPLRNGRSEEGNSEKIGGKIGKGESSSNEDPEEMMAF